LSQHIFGGAKVAAADTLHQLVEGSAEYLSDGSGFADAGTPCALLCTVFSEIPALSVTSACVRPASARAACDSDGPDRSAYLMVSRSRLDGPHGPLKPSTQEHPQLGL
jgi:hypothetical protein